MSLRLHFLNVGHGDCTVIEFPSGRVAVVDINATAEYVGSELIEAAAALGFATGSLRDRSRWPAYLLRSEFLERAGFSELADPIPYIRDVLDGRAIFRFIATHPHMDHLSGLAALLMQLPLFNFWYTAPGVEKPDFSSAPYQEEDWDVFQALVRGCPGIQAISPKTAQEGHYWTDDGIQIWLPTTELEHYAEDNNLPNLASYVLAIRHGNALVVLGGDAEAAVWQCLYDALEGDVPNVTVLKASHHGRKTGYHQPSVKAMSPQLTVISVGKKPPNDASALYSQYSDTVLSTRWHGTIVVTCHENGSCEYESQRTRQDLVASREARVARLSSWLRVHG